MSEDRKQPRRARRRRLIGEGVALGVIACLLVWGLDTAARLGAESLLERDIQEATGVVQRPEVRLGSGPFLLQVIRGAYTEADVEVVGVRTGPLEIERIQAHLSDIRLPLKDVLLRDIRRVGIGRSEDLVTLRFDDLNDYFETTGRALRLTAEENQQIRLTGSFDVLDQTVPVTAAVELTVDGTQLRITPRDVDTGDTTLSEAGRLLLDQRISLTVPMDNLPLGSQLTGLEITSEELRISATSTAVILRP